MRLTDEALARIAEDVRTRPLTEVGRHVMPLLHHIQSMEDAMFDLATIADLYAPTGDEETAKEIERLRDGPEAATRNEAKQGV